MSEAVCPTCEHIHCARDVVAVGRFVKAGVWGYRNQASKRVHPTREDAIADLCDRRAAMTTPTTNPTAAATRAELTAEQED